LPTFLLVYYAQEGTVVLSENNYDAVWVIRPNAACRAANTIYAALITCLQNNIIIQWLIINSLKMWQSSNIWERR